MKYLSFIGFFVLIAAWLLAADVSHVASAQLLPPLQDVLKKLWLISANGSLAIDLKDSLYRWAIGFALGAFSGMVVGLLLGVNPRVYKACEFPIEFFRTLPVTAIFPLFLIIFGIGDASKIAMAFTPTFLLMLINTAYGVLHAPPHRGTMAKAFGASPWQVLTKITIFDVLPQIVVGVRLALSLSMIATIVSEMFIGSEHGLGQRIYDSYLTNDVQTLYAVLIVLGVIGYGLNKAVIKLEKRYVFWSGK